MKIELVELDEVEYVSLPWGRITKTRWDKEQGVAIDAGGFNIVIHPGGLKLQYIIHRNHDHNNMPTILFEMPEEGKVIEYKNSAKLTVKDDSSHLSLDMKYDNYVWETDLDLVVKQWEHKALREIYKRRGLDALLKKIGVK